MKITFAGTGSGVTSLKRYHSSFLIENKDYKLLVDAGDGVSRALIQAGIHFEEINGILFSHFHPDHLNGISSLLIQMKMQKRSSRLNIFVHENLRGIFLKFLEINYIFTLKLGFELEIITFKITGFLKIKERFEFTAKENSHLVKLSDFVKPEDKTLISCSFLFDIEGNKLFYSGDLGSKDDLYLFKDISIDYLISEISHIELPDLYSAFKFFSSPLLFITHIADEIETQLKTWQRELKIKDKNRVVIAEDGLQVVL